MYQDTNFVPKTHYSTIGESLEDYFNHKTCDTVYSADTTYDELKEQVAELFWSDETIDTLMERIEKAYSDGDITDEEYSELLANCEDCAA